MALIFHIADAGDWEQARAQGEYRVASLDSEGFIHLSTAQQVVPVANRFYTEIAGLVLLVVDSQRLSADLRYEPPVPAENTDALFPHLYGPLNLDAVVDVVQFSPGADGYFVMPPGY